MKKIYFTLAIAIANFSYAQTVDFESFSLASDSEWNGSDLSGTVDSVMGTDTVVYYNSVFNFSGLNFTNQWHANWGYLSGGWAFSSRTSDTIPNLGGAYNSYAGGGADGSSKYAITHIGGGKEMAFESGVTAVFSDISVTNSSYAGLSMLNGDAFYGGSVAKKFGGATGDDADWFLLSVVGYDAAGTVTDTVKFYMADYRFSTNSQDYIIKDWSIVDLSSLGAVNKIRFELSSSDNDVTWGMNTPAYLALDNINFSSYTSINETVENNVTVYPNPATSELNINSNFNEGNLSVYNMTGQQVISLSLNSYNTQLNVANLPVGIYTLRIQNNKEVITSRFVKK